MIAVVDYGMGNIHSCLKAVSLHSSDYEFTPDPDKIRKADAVILPGDGAFQKAMDNLNSSGQRDALDEFVKSGKPLLGICIGFQILFQNSDETRDQKQIEGLGYVKGKIRRFSGKPKKYKVPHIGWNQLLQTSVARKKTLLLQEIPDKSFMYFIHSYRAVGVPEKVCVAKCNYYDEKFTAIVEKENLFGTQFHPEKSHTLGLKILENFVSSI